MRALTHILTLIAILAAIFIIATFYIGYFTQAFANGAGMAILAFQLYGTIAAVLALLLGLIGQYISRKTRGRRAFISTLGIYTGLLGLTALAGLSFLG